jgi:NitT/TauT family transport system permease protein
VSATPTFPTLGALHRLGVRPLDVVVGGAVLLLLVAAVSVGQGAAVAFVPSHVSGIDTSPANLPYYAARSLLRMFVALFFSTVFSFGYAYAAARSRRARQILVPTLDILQSVPVLGFLSITITFFIALFPGSLLGLEAASVFAIFTAQAWNMTFSFYHSLVTQPPELDEASRVMGLTRWRRFWSLDVPSGAIGLVWNGMMSFGGGWFFLAASEQISVLNKSYTLPGVGSYVAAATARGELGHVGLAIVTMVVMVLAVNVLFWRPLTAYAERFRVELSESSEQPRSLVLDAIRHTRWPGLIARGGRVVARPVDRVMGALTGIDDRTLVVDQGRRRFADAGLLAVVAVVIALALYRLLTFVAAGPGLGVFVVAFGLGCVTFLRVVVLVIGATLIWVPVGVWIGFNPRVTRFMQPVVQVLASFPANFLFPFATALFIALHVSLDIGGVLLMALGTQWYVLFNVIAGASAVPTDLKEAMDNLGVHGIARWRRLILPSIFPAYVTGAITAAGGAWNASIVAEVVTYNGHTLMATGLGAYLAQATAAGDFHRILPSLVVMSFFVVAVNGLFWRRLYRLAETRYSLT